MPQQKQYESDFQVVVMTLSDFFYFISKLTQHKLSVSNCGLFLRASRKTDNVVFPGNKIILQAFVYVQQNKGLILYYTTSDTIKMYEFRLARIGHHSRFHLHDPTRIESWTPHVGWNYLISV